MFPLTLYICYLLFLGLCCSFQLFPIPQHRSQISVSRNVLSLTAFNPHSRSSDSPKKFYNNKQRTSSNFVSNNRDKESKVERRNNIKKGNLGGGSQYGDFTHNYDDVHIHEIDGREIVSLFDSKRTANKPIVIAKKKRVGSSTGGAFRVVMRKPPKASVVDNVLNYDISGGKLFPASVGSKQDELRCIHFASCSGCSLQSSFTQSPIMQRARKFFAAHGLSNPLPIHIHTNSKFRGDNNPGSSSIAGWRSHAKLVVQPMSKWGGVKVGLYRRGSHEVGETISSCQVHHPRINEALEIFRRVAIDTGIPIYSPFTASMKQKRIDKLHPAGAIRYVTMSVERAPPHRIALVVVLHAEDYKSIADFDGLTYFLKKLKHQTGVSHNHSKISSGQDNIDEGGFSHSLWHSISLNFNPDSNSNSIYYFGPKGDEGDMNAREASSYWKLAWGLPFLKEKIGNVTCFLKPQVFRQANLDGFESMIIPMIDRFVPKGSTVAELYSGIGVIGLNLAYKADKVLCSDSNPFIDELFDRAALTLPQVRLTAYSYRC